MIAPRSSLKLSASQPNGGAHDKNLRARWDVSSPARYAQRIEAQREEKNMSEIDRVLRAFLADVCEQGVALEAAVEKIYSGAALREAKMADGVRKAPRHEIAVEAGTEISQVSVQTQRTQLVSNAAVGSGGHLPPHVGTASQAQREQVT
jgi:hypothetical protein